MNTKLSPLAALNAHIAQASQAAAGGLKSSADQWPELRSAQRFRETWERLSAEDAVVKATHRAPENAGPLNSHMLVLRTLGLMRELSPHYLRRFLSHTETLLWLEQFLLNWGGSFVLVSHDRSLLDRVTNCTWILRDKNLQFIRLRMRRRAQHLCNAKRGQFFCRVFDALNLKPDTVQAIGNGLHIGVGIKMLFQP